MKTFFFLFLFCGIKLFAHPDPLISDQKNLALILEDEDATKQPFISLQCSNAFEWEVDLPIKTGSITFSLSGLGNDLPEDFLFNSDQLFYHPEIQNTQMDFSACRKWEMKMRVSINLQHFFRHRKTAIRIFNVGHPNL